LRVLISLLVAVCCLLAVPGAASAVEYEVNATNDEPDANPGTGDCLTAGSVCSLRAAIQEANATTGIIDTIKFAPSFNGEVATDTIAIGVSFPVIIDPVHIDGDRSGQCEPIASIFGPCVGVEKTGGGLGLQVEDDDVTIDGLAVTGATNGINVINASQDFIARDNWIGLKLDGSPGGNSTGIFLDPDSSSAEIGGVNAAERNVFANNGVGLDIEGGDSNLVRGNYFGVKPDGSTAAGNSKNIEITDSTSGSGFAAEDNEVGATVVSGVAPCDGGCNVISGATGYGVDLQGESGGNEKPATGPTIVHGNYVGLNATGTATVANTIYGIYVGEAPDVLVGGASNQDANFVAGGGEGIASANAEGLEVIGNIIGSGAAGAEITAPGKAVFVLNTNNANRVAVSKNVFEMNGGVGIQVNFGGADVIGNFIEGAELGVLTRVGPNAAGGNLIEDNVIGESLANGILIEDDFNEILGNAVYQSGAAGIRLQNPAALLVTTENLIGGDVTTDENNINESGGDAIEIVDLSGSTEDDSLNEVARNKGAKNAGLFIDLVGAANAGILPPAFGTVIQSSVSGTAEPGALIRVFRKKAVEAGEIESFLSEAVADGSGNWKVGYAGQIPTGTIVAATQTSEAGGTSELSVATTTVDPVSGGGSAGGGGKDDKGKDGKVKGKGKDDKVKAGTGGALDTQILKGPKAKTHATTVKFKFTASEKGAKFECKLDRKKFKPCKSPKTYKKLKPGKHVFKVRAVKGKTVDPTPAKRKFKVLA